MCVCVLTVWQKRRNSSSSLGSAQCKQYSNKMLNFSFTSNELILILASSISPLLANFNSATFIWFGTHFSASFYALLRHWLVIAVSVLMRWPEQSGCYYANLLPLNMQSAHFWLLKISLNWLVPSLKLNLKIRIYYTPLSIAVTILWKLISITQ